MKPANDQEKEDWYLDVSDQVEEYASDKDDYSSVWIDKELLDYSLRGIEAIKV
jgi:hypothetical protein